MCPISQAFPVMFFDWPWMTHFRVTTWYYILIISTTTLHSISPVYTQHVTNKYSSSCTLRCIKGSNEDLLQCFEAGLFLSSLLKNQKYVIRMVFLKRSNSGFKGEILPICYQKNCHLSKTLNISKISPPHLVKNLNFPVRKSDKIAKKCTKACAYLKSGGLKKT